jgi:hypothetical protein
MVTGASTLSGLVVAESTAPPGMMFRVGSGSIGVRGIQWQGDAPGALIYFSLDRGVTRVRLVRSQRCPTGPALLGSGEPRGRKRTARLLW